MHRLIVTVVAVLFARPALAASDPVAKVRELAAAGKIDKAWASCEKQKEGGALTGTMKEVCGDVAFQMLLDGASAAGPDIRQLAAFAELWKGAPVADKAADMASKRSLIAAGTDPDLIAEVIAAWPDTAAATEGYNRLWKQTLNANTSAAMRSFHERHPDAPQAADAKKLELELAWSEVSRSPTVEGLKQFQLAYPAHAKKDQALALEYSLVFSAAEAKNTPSAWDQLVSAYPRHPRVNEARSRSMDLGYAAAEKAGPDALLAFAMAHPEYPRAAAVVATLLKERTLVQAGSAAAALPSNVGGAGLLTVLPIGSSAIVPALPAGVDTLMVRLPVPGVVPKFSVEILANGQRQTLAAAMPPRLRALGVPDAQIPPSWELAWTVVEGANVGRLPPGLCQPEGADVYFALLMTAGGMELGYPFQLVTRCSAAPRAKASP